MRSVVILMSCGSELNNLTCMKVLSSALKNLPCCLTVSLLQWSTAVQDGHAGSSGLSCRGSSGQSYMEGFKYHDRSLEYVDNGALR